MEVNTWTLNKIQWIYTKSTHKRHVFKTYEDIFHELYPFLNNLTVKIDTCTQFPVGMLFNINQCDKVESITHQDDIRKSGLLLTLYSPCNVREFTRITFYHTKPTAIEIFLFVTLETKELCDPLCQSKTIIIHEVMPDEGIVYQYNFCLYGSI